MAKISRQKYERDEFSQFQKNGTIRVTYVNVRYEGVCEALEQFFHGSRESNGENPQCQLAKSRKSGNGEILPLCVCKLREKVIIPA